MIIKNVVKNLLLKNQSFKHFLHRAYSNASAASQRANVLRAAELANTLRSLRFTPGAYRYFMAHSMNEIKGNPEDLLLKLPRIRKVDIRNNMDTFKNSSYRGFVFKGSTTGTTGSPCMFLRDLKSISFEHAMAFRHWRRESHDHTRKRVTLRGDIICPIKRMVPPFWQYNWYSKELIMSSYHLNDVNMRHYAAKIREFGPEELYAYPSSAYLFADYCLRHGCDIGFKYVFTSSESLLDNQREVIERAFGCRVYDWYGQAERVAAIASNDEGEYEVVEDYSYVEFMPHESGYYEIVGTTFNNEVMPLVRYRTGDLVEATEEGLASFPRKVKRIIGRQSSYLQTPDGRRVSIVNHIGRGVNGIIECQFAQTSKDGIVIKVVSTADFNHKEQDKLINSAKSHISDKMSILVEKVSSIDRTGNGKFREIIGLHDSAASQNNSGR